jgi:hypothetical protein
MIVARISDSATKSGGCDGGRIASVSVVISSSLRRCARYQLESQSPAADSMTRRLMGMLAVAGGHVVPGQPVTWLRVRTRAGAPPLQVLDLTHYLRHRIAHTGQRSKD